MAEPEQTDWPGLDVTPAPPTPVEHRGRRFSRWLRGLAGIDEDVLAWVPGERARYTALGGVVLGTATIAAFSMLAALTEILDRFSILLLLPMAIWGLFVLNLDRWLITSSAGTRWHRSFSIFVPRVVLAFFLGVVIAEPLVLRIFEPAIERHIQNERQVELQTLTSSLLRCNPDPTTDEATRQRAQEADCADLHLNLEATHAAIAQELARKQDQAKVLRDSIAADDAEQARRDLLAANECAGTPGPGTTGRPGRGPECREREREAAEFRSAHSTGERTARLAELNRQIQNLLTDESTAQQTYQDTRDQRIQQEVDERASQHGAIGLLERLETLHQLTTQNAALGLATWFIRIFLILVDCLPVIVKFLGGRTRYDALVDLRAEAMRRAYEQGVKTNELDIIAAFRARQREVENESSKRRASADLDLRWHEANLDVELSRKVDQLADTLHGTRLPPDTNATTSGGNGRAWQHPFGSSGLGGISATEDQQ